MMIMPFRKFWKISCPQLLVALLLVGCSQAPTEMAQGVNPDWRDVKPSDDIDPSAPAQFAAGIKPVKNPAAVAGSGSSPSAQGWGIEKSQRAQRIAETDNAGPGYCAKGVANILEGLGYPVSRGNAHDWDTNLPAKGWTKVECSPQTCPPGTVLQYESNVQLGKWPRSTGGQRWGHVEIVTETSNGRRYCSDACRNNFGGTVRENFAGAWVYGGN